ncbi:MAG: hemolysin family protein [Bacteroidales bacterium]|nr:hemolysin family protein [Bacteroidales bacterium]
MDLIIILLLIFLNGFFSMSEVALIAARKSGLQLREKQGSKSAKTALKLKNHPDIFLSAIQIGITLIGILTGIFSSSAFAADFAKTLEKIGCSALYSLALSQTLIVIIITFLTIVFGELIPKRIGLSFSEKKALQVAPIMHIFAKISTPFVWILSKSTSLIFKLFGIKNHVQKITEEEIKYIIEEGKNSGVVQEVEQDIVERVFSLGDRKIESIMTPRNDIVWLNTSATNQQIIELITNDLHEVYPIAQDSLDHLKGVVYLKELFGKLDDPNFSLEQMIRPAHFLQENIAVYSALEKFKSKKIKFSLIYNEFGSIQGVVTLKDMLEALVGTIPEANEEQEIVQRQSGGWLIDGHCSLYNFLTYFEIEEYFSQYECHTLSGLVLEILEHIPHTGEKVSWKNFTFEIMDMDGIRIDKILVEKNININE